MILKASKIPQCGGRAGPGHWYTLYEYNTCTYVEDLFLLVLVKRQELFQAKPSQVLDQVGASTDPVASTYLDGVIDLVGPWST